MTTNNTNNQGVTSYREPTYNLHLAPVKPLNAYLLEPIAAQARPYDSLHHLVDQIVHERYRDQWASLSPKKKSKIRVQVAYSLMNRPDQESSLDMKVPLAKSLGLYDIVMSRLKKIVGNANIDLAPLADFVFSDQGIHDGTLLYVCVFHVTKSPLLINLLFGAVMDMRKELQDLTKGKMTYIRPPQLADGKAYKDHNGNTIALTQTIPSSYDRDHPDVQNARLNLNQKGHVIYSAGRIESPRKAHQVINCLVDKTCSSGQLTKTDLIPQEDGTYLYPFVVENMVSAAPIAVSERKFLLQEKETLADLTGQIKVATLVDGSRVQLKLQPIYFSTQTNYNSYFPQWGGWSSTGADIAQELFHQGVNTLEAIFRNREASLPSSHKKAIEFCLNALKNDRPSARDQLILRAYICELLKIPYHAHCKSSKDRTAPIVAIKKAIHQWLTLEQWKGKKDVPQDPRLFFKDSAFRELSEAAFFENLPMTDQGVGFSGELGGKLYTQNRGYDYRHSLFEHTLPTSVLTSRNVYSPSLLQRIATGLALSIFSLVVTTLYVALFPIVLAILYVKYKEHAWEVWKYLFLTLLILPFRSGTRAKWLDRKSETMQERSFCKTNHPTQIAPSLQILFDKIETLDSSQKKALIRFVKSGEPTSLNDDQKKILQEIANNWVSLQMLYQSKGSLPSTMKQLLDAAKNSPVQLFKYLNHFNEETVWSMVEKSHFSWPSDNYADTLIRDGLEGDKDFQKTRDFRKDFPRTSYVIQGQNKSYDFPRLSDKTQFVPTLQKELSVFKTTEGIPFPVQEALAQFTSLSFLLGPIWDACSGDKPFNCSRTFTLQEGDDSFFWLKVDEEATISSLTFKYSYSFKITKKSETEWTTTLMAISPFQPKTAAIDDSLLQIVPSEDVLSNVREINFQAFMNNLQINLESAAKWTPDKGKHLIEAVQKRLEYHWTILSTKFDTFLADDTRTEVDGLLGNFVQQFNCAETDEGKTVIALTADSYIQFLEKTDPMFNVQDFLDVLEDENYAELKPLGQAIQKLRDYPSQNKQSKASTLASMYHGHGQSRSLL